MTAPGGPALRPLVIALDGPAGAGKSTVTRTLADRLGILFLDTGAMYRATTVGLFAAGVDRDDPAAVAAFVTGRTVDFDAAGQVRLDGAVLPRERIRSPETTREIWRVADNPACRAHLVAQQQALVRGRDCVIEGRDATTVICPEAQLKVYLDATPVERARRRLAEWSAQGRTDLPSLDTIAAEIEERDARDRGRAVGALMMADDAVHLVTDGMAPEVVVARLIALAVQRHPFILERAVTDQVVVGRSRQPGYVSVADGGDGRWKLGLTNPSDGRIPGTVRDLTRNHGGRQAGTVVQGAALLLLAGRGEQHGPVVALPMLPQTWYVIEPGAWHAVVQAHGTICAWAEADGLREERRAMDPVRQAELEAHLAVLLPK
jgi:cytidylate kinase